MAGKPIDPFVFVAVLDGDSQSPDRLSAKRRDLRGCDPGATGGEIAFDLGIPFRLVPLGEPRRQRRPKNGTSRSSTVVAMS
jgi:hypothetical protein